MFKVVLPVTHLKKYVAYFWDAAVEHIAGQEYIHNAVACSKPELLFRYTGNYESIAEHGMTDTVLEAGFYGQSNQFRNYRSTSAQTGLFGVRFHPQALSALFNIPASELTNEKSDIIHVLGKEGAKMSAMVLEAKTFVEKINIVTWFLEKRLRTVEGLTEGMEHVFGLINNSNGLVPINELVSKSYLSERQFERCFKTLSGFSPRTYLKIVRFEHLMQCLNSKLSADSATLTSIALDCGYYDQAHLNRHFKEFTGHSPSAYLQIKKSQGL